MRTRVVTCLLLAVLGVPAFAEEAATEKTEGIATTSASAEEAMSPEMTAMMKAWEEAGTPGTPHSHLGPLAGTFDVKVDSWMEMGAPVTSSTGRSENRMIFGGRYLEQRFTGTFMEQPFEGVGYMGYDNVKKQYFSTWIDSMSTMMMTTTGKADAAGRILTFSGECADPATGKAQSIRSVVTVNGPNQHVFEMWGPDMKTGKEYKTMVITYTRAGTM